VLSLLSSLAKNLRCIHFKVLFLTYNSMQSSQPTYLRKLFTIQSIRPIRSPSCLTLSRPRSLLISCSPTEPYPSLHHVFRWSTTWTLCLLFTSTTITANHKTSSSSGSSIHHPRAFHSTLNVISSRILTLIHLIIHPPNLNDTHLNSYSVFSDPLKNRTWADHGAWTNLWTTSLIRRSSRK